MNKLRISIITLLSAVLFAVCAVFLCSVQVAYADSGRTVTLTDKNVFYAPTGGASIAPVNVAADGEDALYYTLFLFDEDDQQVTYRKNLAYSWYAAGSDGNVVNGKFTMTVGFYNLTFERFTIRFQSQQYNKTKDGVTSNYLIFVPDDEGEGVRVILSDDEDAEPDGQNTEVFTGKITISFGEFDGGNYAVTVADEDGAVYSGTLNNVFETFSKYVSSGSTACMPLTFSAQFAADENGDRADETETAGLLMYSLNGQSFQIYNVEADDEGGLSGDLIDDVAPVLCLGSNVNYLTYGEAIDLTYTVIDVIASSPRSSVYFYVLTKDQYEDDEMNYDMYYEDDDDLETYTKITTSTDIILQRDTDTFVPSAYLTEDGELDEVYGLVKIYVKVYDVSGSSGMSDYVFIDWYVADEYKVNIYGEDLKNDLLAESCFIKILDDGNGPSYGFDLDAANAEATDADAVIQAYKDYVETIRADYQAQIDAVIAALENEDGEDGVLYAGSSSNVYLPAFCWSDGSGAYITDLYGGYTDLKYSIYYKASSSSSNTMLSSSQLSLAVTQAEVYTFTIIASDAAGNVFRIPVEDDDGNVVWEEIDTSLVWDEEYADMLPFFTVEAEYQRASAEEPGEQSIAYVGTTYNGVSFEINGISGTYSTSYRLFIFDRDAYYEEEGVSLTYAEFVELLNSVDEDGNTFFENYRKYFTEVYEEDELLEDDDNYDTNAAYSWNSSNVTFIPQSSGEFYAVELSVTDTEYNYGTLKYYMGIRASAEANALEGENYWLENNLTSIILLSIAGACFIALIIVLFIKPKEKNDIDVIDVDLENKKKSKKRKNKSKADGKS